MGVHEIVAFAMAVPMLVDVLTRRRIVVPRGFGLWLLFLGWVVGSVLVLQVNAPFAVPGGNPTRYLTWGYRLTWYLLATITFLYVINNRSLSTVRIARTLGWMFVTTTIGGLVGTLFPLLEFPSLVELLLPGGLVSDPFVYNIVHPTVAQIQYVLGYAAPRPSAPFNYANIWGLNFACLLPFFVHGWLGRDAGWRRWVAPFVLVVAVVPVIFSANRGLWAALVVMLAFVVIRAGFRGHPGTLVLVSATVAVMAVVLALSPLGSLIGERLSGDSGNSNEGRSNLGTTMLVSVAQKSPVVGYGTTREVQGNWSTIAGGETAACPRCSPPSFGTQGQASLVIFSQGLVGFALFLSFFLMLFLRHVRSRAPTATAALATLVASFVTMPVYNSTGLALVVIMIAAGVLWRDDPEVDASGVRARTLEAQLRRLGRQLPVVVACVLLGGALGAAVQALRGVDTRATVEVLLPRENAQVEQNQGRLTADTLAQLATSDPVLRATRAVRAPEDVDDDLTITATPNTQILHLTFSSAHEHTALAAVSAAQEEFLEVHRTAVQERRQLEIERLTDAIVLTETAVEHDLVRIAEHRDHGHPAARQAAITGVLNGEITQLRGEIATLGAERRALQEAPPAEGRVLQGVRSNEVADYWRVALANGLLLGLAIGVLLAVWRDRRGHRISTPDDITVTTGLPVLAMLHAHHRSPALALATTGGPAAADEAGDPVVTMLASYRADACLAVGSGRSESDGRALARRLDHACRRMMGAEQSPARRVILVIAPGARVTTARREVARLSRLGVTVVGAVFVVNGDA